MVYWQAVPRRLLIARSHARVFDAGPLAQFGVFHLSGIVALAVLMLVLGDNTRAQANIVISAPAGLNSGDTFRIAFVTFATTAPTSNSIATYNTFVNTDATAEAGGGSVTYNGSPLAFFAIGSTSSVNAITNIGQTGSPVYLADGSQVATSDTSSPGGLWSGTLLAPLQEDLLSTHLDRIVFTGTQTTGLGVPGAELGSGGSSAEAGFSTMNSSGWIASAIGTGVTSIYGISNPLTVPAPEPSSIVLGTFAAGIGALGAYARRRKVDRRLR